ncbi:IS701 family transposase [Streptomyces ortus]|uniref:IS701 family transposase n=1 Tax=Streptomyces TaxID=1883 RepID=UPI003EB6B758
MDVAPSEAWSTSRNTTYGGNSGLTLDRFSGTIFKSLRRIDQRKMAHAYLEGLLVTSGKKSLRRLATAISPDPSAVQSLRQFVSLSPWNFDEVMEELTRWVTDHDPEPIWPIGRAVMPKRGDRSVGVHRYFDPSSGRTLNCQLGLGSFLRVGTTQVPVDWCLHLPMSWTQDSGRRRDARIPDAERYRPMWRHTLRLVDRLSARTGSTSSVTLVDMSDEPDVEHLLSGLAKRHRDFVVAVAPHLPVQPAGETAGGPVTARALAFAQTPETAVVPLDSGRQRVAHLQTTLVHLPRNSQGRSPGPPYRLFTEGGPAHTSGRLWLTSLTHHTLSEVCRVAALHAGTTDVIASMERDFGLLDFEGRSFPGWYHHTALVSAAYTYQRLHGRAVEPSREMAERVL